MRTAGLGAGAPVIETNEAGGAVGLSGSWSLRSNGSARGGSEHVTSSPGAGMTISFTGAALGLWYTRSLQGGRFELLLDAETPQQQHLGVLDQCGLSTDPGGSLSQVRHTVSGFASGAHVLTLRMVASTCQGNGSTEVTVDAFQAQPETGWASYDADNRLLQWSVGGQLTEHEWDANGSSLRQSTGGIATVRTYDAHQRMQSQSTAGGLQAQFSYHPDGIRGGRTIDGQLTSYVQDGTGLGKVLQSTTNGQTTSHVPGLAHYDPSQASESERWAYQHDDRGSHRSQSDAGANARGKQSYDAWGALQSQSGLPNSDFGWATEQRDPTGLIYLRARYYDPSIGRFLARDPILGDLTDPQSWNRYSYAGNDPVNGSDPSGLKPDGNDKKKKLRACRNPGQYTGSCKGGPPNKKYIINEWDLKNIEKAEAEGQKALLQPAVPAEASPPSVQEGVQSSGNVSHDLLREVRPAGGCSIRGVSFSGFCAPARQLANGNGPQYPVADGGGEDLGEILQRQAQDDFNRMQQEVAESQCQNRDDRSVVYTFNQRCVRHETLIRVEGTIRTTAGVVVVSAVARATTGGSDDDDEYGGYGDKLGNPNRVRQRESAPPLNSRDARRREQQEIKRLQKDMTLNQLEQFTVQIETLKKQGGRGGRGALEPGMLDELADSIKKLYK